MSYQDLSFYCQIMDYEPASEEELYLTAPLEEAKALYASIDLEKTEVVYIYGLALGHYAAAFMPWLEEKPGRDLVFIEDQLGVVDLFLRKGEVIDHPNVHILWQKEGQSVEELAEEAAGMFPVQHLLVAGLAAYTKGKKEKFEQLQEWIYRKTTLTHAALLEKLHHHELFRRNILPNSLQLHRSHAAKDGINACVGTPAIICGAGPSLEEAIPYLEKSGALLFAGGSAITALARFGILPDFGMAIDPNEEEESRLAPLFGKEFPFVYGLRLRGGIVEKLPGPLFYLPGETPGSTEEFLHEELGIAAESPEGSSEALSITTSCISLAQQLGCSPIILAGVDLCYLHERAYASGILSDARVDFSGMEKEQRASEILLERTSEQGDKVYTNVKWIMESHWIADFAKRHPETAFYNGSKGGLGFSGIPSRPLSEWDFSDSLSADFFPFPLPFTQTKVVWAWKKLHASMKRCQAIVSSLIDQSKKDGNGESPLATLLIRELKEERAFAILEGAIQAYSYLAGRKTSVEEVKAREFVELQGIIAHYLDSFALYGL